MCDNPSFFKYTREHFTHTFVPNLPPLAQSSFTVSTIRYSSFFLTMNSMTSTYHQFTRPQPAGEKHLGCFQSTAVSNNAAMKGFLTEIFPDMNAVYQLHLRSETAQSKNLCILILILSNYPPKSLQIYTFPVVSESLASAVTWIPSVFDPCQSGT